MTPNLRRFENKAREKGFAAIAGIDEAGRGPLAGPVVAAAVIFPPDLTIDGIDDSKKLTPKKRDTLLEIIYREAISVGIGIVDPEEIERTNILKAALLAMAMAVGNLCPPADCLLIDGIFPIASPLPQETIPKGDSRSISIAAASIVAKETRDHLMRRYHEEYPEFGFDRHMGYPTKAHKAAIAAHGVCPIHRRTFRGVREFLAGV
ncbi:MAG: ribonuclease HII [Desulfobacterales bacterium]|nr:ribonuclease HII [Desulfobacterales bacterium]